jgi:hypothetical protein
MTTAIQLPAVLFDANASVDVVVVLASLLVCCTSVIAASVRGRSKEKRRRAPTTAYRPTRRTRGRPV